MSSAKEISSAANISSGLSSFAKVKLELNANIPNVTWYCGCPISNHKISLCNLGIKYDKPLQIEWDHVVPAAMFPRPKKCEGDSGGIKTGKSRACSRRLSRRFSLAEADPVNLVAAESAVNQLKGGKIPGFSRDIFTSHCGFEVNSYIFNPPKELRGDVARIWFHMNEKHFNGRLIHKSLSLILLQWAAEDPISKEERMRSKDLLKIGGRHLFVQPD